MAGYVDILREIGSLCSKVENVEGDIGEIKRSLNGNGKIGLIDDHKALKQRVSLMNSALSDHLKEVDETRREEEKAKKEEIRIKSERKFEISKAILILALGQVLTFLVTLASILIKRP